MHRALLLDHDFRCPSGKVAANEGFRLSLVGHGGPASDDVVLAGTIARRTGADARRSFAAPALSFHCVSVVAVLPALEPPRVPCAARRQAALRLAVGGDLGIGGGEGEVDQRAFVGGRGDGRQGAHLAVGEVAAFEGVFDARQVEQGVGDAQFFAGRVLIQAAGGVQPRLLDNVWPVLAGFFESAEPSRE